MKIVSISENYLFQKAYTSGKRFGGKRIVIYILTDKKADFQRRKNPEKKAINRVGISVSKKIGNAVVRSRARRVIREGYRALDPELVKGKLIIIAARPGADKSKSYEIEKEMRYGFNKLLMFRNAVDSDRHGEKGANL